MKHHFRFRPGFLLVIFLGFVPGPFQGSFPGFVPGSFPGPGSAHARKAYSPGHVILNNGDTLQGMIRERGDDEIFEKIRFRSEATGSRKYGPHDLKGFRINDEEFESLWFEEESEFFLFNYYSRPGSGKKIFLRVLVRGPVSCYYYEYVDYDSGYRDGFALFKRDQDDYFERANQGIFGLKKKRLIRYFSDCQSLVDRLEMDLLRTPLEVVNFYNAWCAQ